jgi:hypothetical protein
MIGGRLPAIAAVTTPCEEIVSMMKVMQRPVSSVAPRQDDGKRSRSTNAPTDARTAVPTPRPPLAQARIAGRTNAG